MAGMSVQVYTVAVTLGNTQTGHSVFADGLQFLGAILGTGAG